MALDLRQRSWSAAPFSAFDIVLQSSMPLSSHLITPPPLPDHQVPLHQPHPSQPPSAPSFPKSSCPPLPSAASTQSPSPPPLQLAHRRPLISKAGPRFAGTRASYSHPPSPRQACRRSRVRRRRRRAPLSKDRREPSRLRSSPEALWVVWQSPEGSWGRGRSMLPSRR